MLIQSIVLCGHANILAAGQAQATEHNHYELHIKSWNGFGLNTFTNNTPHLLKIS